MLLKNSWINLKIVSLSDKIKTFEPYSKQNRDLFEIKSPSDLKSKHSLRTKLFVL